MMTKGETNSDGRAMAPKAIRVPFTRWKVVAGDGTVADVRVDDRADDPQPIEAEVRRRLGR